MNAIKRGLRGALLGAAVATVIAVTPVVLLFGYQILVLDASVPVDRANDVRHFTHVLPLTAVAGIIVGAFGGFAARMPQKGAWLLTSIGIVAGCAVVGRVFAEASVQSHFKPQPSYIPVILAALFGGVIVLLYGIIATMRAPTNAEAGDAEEADRVSACIADTSPQSEAFTRQ